MNARSTGTPSKCARGVRPGEELVALRLHQVQIATQRLAHDELGVDADRLRPGQGEARALVDTDLEVRTRGQDLVQAAQQIVPGHRGLRVRHERVGWNPATLAVVGLTKPARSWRPAPASARGSRASGTGSGRDRWGRGASLSAKYLRVRRSALRTRSVRSFPSVASSPLPSRARTPTLPPRPMLGADHRQRSPPTGPRDSTEEEKRRKRSSSPPRSRRQFCQLARRQIHYIEAIEHLISNEFATSDFSAAASSNGLEWRRTM